MAPLIKIKIQFIQKLKTKLLFDYFKEKKDTLYVIFSA